MSINNIISRAANVLVILFIGFTVFPAKLNYSSIAIIALMVLAVINMFINNGKAGKRSWLLFLLSAPVLVYSFGLLNTANLDSGVNFITRNLSFLAFPFIFFSLGEKIQQKIVLYSFLCSLFLVNLYLIYLFIYYFNFGERFYKIVTIDIYHSTYLGLYNLSGYWVAIYLFAKSKKRKYILLSIFLVAAAMITSARIIFFLSLLSLFFSALIFLKSTKHRVVAVIAIALLSFFVYNYTPSIKQKFSQFNEIEHVGFDKGNHRGVSSRLGNIQASYELIKRNPFFGTGTGDLLDELLEEYDRMKFTMGYKYRYNPHNQYLSYLVRNGFIGGGICILILYLFPFYFVLRRNDVLLFGFMLLVLGVSLTESFLDVHKGITFYAFFMTFLLARYDLDFWGRTQKKL